MDISKINTQLNMLRIEVCDKSDMYIDEKLTYIPENIKIIVEKFLDKNIQNLIKIGKFNIDNVDSYSYGGAGCGDNYRISYVNSELCKFAITQYYDGSTLNVSVEFNENFNNGAAFIKIINDIKSIQQLWENVLRDMAICEVQHMIKERKERDLYEQLCDAFPVDENDT